MKTMTPASTIVSESMARHHIIKEQPVERSLAVRIVRELPVREGILVVTKLLHGWRRLELAQLILELPVAKLDRGYRAEIEVIAKHHLGAAIRPQIGVLPGVCRILQHHIRWGVAIDVLCLG